MPNVSYNGSTLSACPNTFIVSSSINWVPYFTYMIESVMNGTEIAADWCKGTANAVVLSRGFNEQAAAAGTVEAIEEAKAKLASGEIHVFDTATFTVGGQTLTSYQADVDTDANYTPDTEVISDGYFPRV